MEELKKFKFVFIGFLIFDVIFILVFIDRYDYSLKRKNSSYHYVNDLYKSEELMYNKYLNSTEKNMYDIIVDQTIKHKSKIDGTLSDYNCKNYNLCGNYLNNAFEALLVDHPELMNLSGYEWRSYEGSFDIKIRFSYLLRFKDIYGEYKIDKILDKIEEDTKNMTDKEKIIYVYNWMSEHASYDRQYSVALSKNQSIYYVFLEHEAVCAGFAKASQVIFQRIGIKSYPILGVTTGPHMWNVVEYNGKYYFFDATVGVSHRDHKDSNFYYNGLRQNYMNNYSVNCPNWYPKIETTNMFEI